MDKLGERNCTLRNHSFSLVNILGFNKGRAFDPIHTGMSFDALQLGMTLIWSVPPLPGPSKASVRTDPGYDSRNWDTTLVGSSGALQNLPGTSFRSNLLENRAGKKDRQRQ